MLYLLIAVVFLAACSQRVLVPNQAATDYVCDDPELAAAFMAAAKEWGDAGVYAAQIFTMNEVPDGVPIRRIPRAEMMATCETPTIGQACTLYHGAHYELIGVRDDVTDPARLRVCLLHEIGHILSFSLGHLPKDSIAIMHPDGTSSTITDADLKWVCDRAPCDDAATARAANA